MNIYEPIRVEIDSDYSLETGQDVNTGTVYIGGIKIYSVDLGYIYNINDAEELDNARDTALEPLAKFLKSQLL